MELKKEVFLEAYVLQWTFLNFPTFSVFLAIFQVLLDPVPRKMRDRAGRNGLAIQSRGCS